MTRVEINPMNRDSQERLWFCGLVRIVAGFTLVLATAIILRVHYHVPQAPGAVKKTRPVYKPRTSLETSGFAAVIQAVKPWPSDSTQLSVAITRVRI
jgi:hypothetical protein